MASLQPAKHTRACHLFCGGSAQHTVLWRTAHNIFHGTGLKHIIIIKSSQSVACKASIRGRPLNCEAHLEHPKCEPQSPGKEKQSEFKHDGSGKIKTHFANILLSILETSHTNCWSRACYSNILQWYKISILACNCYIKSKGWWPLFHDGTPCLTSTCSSSAINRIPEAVPNHVDKIRYHDGCHDGHDSCESTCVVVGSTSRHAWPRFHGEVDLFFSKKCGNMARTRVESTEIIKSTQKVLQKHPLPVASTNEYIRFVYIYTCLIV